MPLNTSASIAIRVSGENVQATIGDIHETYNVQVVVDGSASDVQHTLSGLTTPKFLFIEDIAAASEGGVSFKFNTGDSGIIHCNPVALLVNNVASGGLSGNTLYLSNADSDPHTIHIIAGE